MERKIGGIFKYEGKKLRVEADNDSECKRCYLNELCPNINKEIIGECVRIHRQDKTSVVFVEVKDEQPQEQAEQSLELNLCEVLKYCPQGETFWSPMFGDVMYYGIIKGEVCVTVASGERIIINADGTLTIRFVTSPEVMLYPSREQRDWTKVKYEPNKEKFDPKTLKAFDKVLVRSEKVFNWNCSLFSNIDDSDSKYLFTCLGLCYRFCIPYNDDTKHLVGTTEEAPDFYKYWED